MCNEACDFIKQQAMDGASFLFVGTKKQAQGAIEDEAKRCGAFYVNQRWLGGTLTNFATISKRIERLHKLYEMEEDGTFDVLPKKEVVNLKNERDKLEKFLGGIKDMKKLPSVMFVIDPKKERIAVLEAKKLGIPVVSVVDTNCDPDDAVALICNTIANAIIEGNQGESFDVPEGAPEEEAAPAPEEPVEQPTKSQVLESQAVYTSKPEENTEE